MLKLIINGQERSFDGDSDTPLLWWLRDEVGLTGTKFGCGAGLCGACTVHLGDTAVRACQTPMSAVSGRSVTTIEGLSANGDHPLQLAWRKYGVPQCGYCQSGQIMQAASLLKEKPNPNEEDIRSAMAGNICRCGTYSRIVTAIKAAAGSGERS